MKRVYVKLFLLFLFSSFFASCISTVENISDNQQLVKETITKEKSLVFGNILWLENGKQKKIGSSIFDFYVKPDLVKLEDKTRVVVMSEKMVILYGHLSLVRM